ncbi:MAG: enoyl-CoA hydratase/isomerase family protein [Lysobacter sp.]
MNNAGDDTTAPRGDAELDETVALRIEAGVARIGIHRPDKRNALATRHWAALEAAFDRVADSPVDLLVLSGVPGAFSAGADIEELGRLLAEPVAFAANNAQVQRTQLKLQRLPQTTIALIDGVCVGGGLGLALACDLRLASDRSRFAITPAKLGLIYSPDDTRRLVNAVGMARARELLLTGRLLDAPTALQWGLLNEVVADSELDTVLASRLEALRATSGQARRGIKQVLGHLGGDASITADHAEDAFQAAFASEDFVEGARAFLDRRAPRFEGGTP